MQTVKEMRKGKVATGHGMAGARGAAACASAAEEKGRTRARRRNRRRSVNSKTCAWWWYAVLNREGVAGDAPCSAVKR